MTMLLNGHGLPNLIAKPLTRALFFSFAIFRLVFFGGTPNEFLQLRNCFFPSFSIFFTLFCRLADKLTLSVIKKKKRERTRTKVS